MTEKFETAYYAHEPAGKRKMRIIKDTLSSVAAILGRKQLRILDVGCGNGHLSAFMSAQGHTVLGIDMYEPSIHAARATYQMPNLVFQKIDLREVRDTYDVITAFEVCEHIPDVENFFHTIYKRLAPHGYFIISVPNGKSVEELLRRFIQHTHVGMKIKNFLRVHHILPKSDTQSSADSPHVHFWGYRQWRTAFEGAGFTHVASHNVSFVFKQFYYIGARKFLKPQHRLFRTLDTWDNAIVQRLPKCLSDGWVMIFQKK